MARNGSGTFNRLYNWEQDAADGIKIRADRMDAEMDGFADGLTNSIAADGQTPVTSNFPMSGFKHTNVDDATQRNQYASLGQVQDSGAHWAGTETGTADAYTITTTPVTIAYAAGQTFRFKIGTGHTNTGACTLSVNGLGTRNLKDQDGNDPVAGAIRAGALYEATYDGTNFIIASYHAGTAYGASLIASADAAAALATLGLSDSDTPNFDGVQLENNEIGGLSDAGTIFWDASHGMYQVDNTNTAHLMWSSQAVTEGDGISITYNGTTDQPTVALDGTYDGSPLVTDATFTTSAVLDAISGASVEAVGTYAFLGRSVPVGTTYASAGDIKPGSELNYDAAGSFSVPGSSPTGSWQCMGHMEATSGSGSVRLATLWLRITV